MEWDLLDPGAFVVLPDELVRGLVLLQGGYRETRCPEGAEIPG
jgi:hypothetical protein